MPPSHPSRFAGPRVSVAGGVAAALLHLAVAAACAGSAGSAAAPRGDAAAPPPPDNLPAPTAGQPLLSGHPGWPMSAAMLERFSRQSAQSEQRGLAQPYRGIVFGGQREAGLFPIRSTGVSTEPVRQAAERFLAALRPEQRQRTMFGVDDPEWRKWMNQHFYLRAGVGLGEMSEAQREAAFGLMQASLSARGLRTSRDIMRLNHTLGEINDDFEQYGEWLYWITLMGEPSATEPWGWQVDGHHLVINYFVLGDQVVMTPTFMGSEPVTATSGRYAGTTVLQDEQNLALSLLQTLSPEQRTKAVVQVSRDGNENVGEAFRDNLDLEYIGLPAVEMTPAQRDQLLALIGTYVGHMREGHAQVRMDEVRRHLDRTSFAWIGGSDSDAVFYYRIQSPVVLIEFDHQTPIALPDAPRGQATRQHIHSVVRTPNGNDYGKDLLRQHYEQHAH